MPTKFLANRRAKKTHRSNKTSEQKWPLKKRLKGLLLSNQDIMEERDTSIQYTKGCCKERREMPSIPLVVRVGRNRL